MLPRARRTGTLTAITVQTVAGHGRPMVRTLGAPYPRAPTMVKYWS
jgi:hypothetical protein